VPPVASPGATSRPPSTAAPEATAPRGGVVDESVSELGMVPEPITRDIEVYADAAFRAFATYDTTKTTRSEFIGHLKTWFTRDMGIHKPEDRVRALKHQRSALYDRVDGLQMWDGLTSTRGTAVARVDGPIRYSRHDEDPTGDMRWADGDVTVTYTQHDGGARPAVQEITMPIRALILCGAETDPTPGSAQKSGDCKLVRIVSARP